MARVIVIGAGLAGLAAAVEAAAAGHEVELHEAAGRAGGRCRSFHDATLDAEIDNGNHLLLSGNRSAMAYLARIGAADRLTGPDGAAFPFLDLETGARWTLSLGDGPLPGWIFDPARRVPGTRAIGYLSALSLLLAGADRTVADVLAAEAPLYHRFWEPLVVAAINDDPAHAAARLMRPVLLETVARGGRFARPLIARRSLADTFVDPALDWLRGQGAAVHLHSRLTGVALEAGRLAGLELGGAHRPLAPGERAVLALPPWQTKPLLPELGVPDPGAPIVNVHYRLPHAPSSGPVRLIGLIGGLTQWIFLRGEIASVTISAARDAARRDAGDIAATCWREVARALELGDMPEPPSRVIKEKRATFAATPDMLNRRPGPRSRWRGLYLAGDWTATGLPATIESAIRSGHNAVKALEQDLT